MPCEPEMEECNAVAVTERIVAFVGGRQAARWDRLGGPGPGLRWCFRHPWLVTSAVAVVLAAVLGATFGVPPFSPLVLVAILVAPIQPVLRAQQRIHTRWLERREVPRGDDPAGDDPAGDDPPAGTTGHSLA